jgi:hypothetical protein
VATSVVRSKLAAKIREQTIAAPAVHLAIAPPRAATAQAETSVVRSKRAATIRDQAIAVRFPLLATVPHRAATVQATTNAARRPLLLPFPEQRKNARNPPSRPPAWRAPAKKASCVCRR